MSQDGFERLHQNDYVTNKNIVPVLKNVQHCCVVYECVLVAGGNVSSGVL